MCGAGLERIVVLFKAGLFSRKKEWVNCGHDGLRGLVR